MLFISLHESIENMNTTFKIFHPHLSIFVPLSKQMPSDGQTEACIFLDTPFLTREAPAYTKLVINQSIYEIFTLGKGKPIHV